MAKRETQFQKMARIFDVVVHHGLRIRGETIGDLAKRIPVMSQKGGTKHCSVCTVYRRMKDPTKATGLELRVYADLFNDYPGGDRLFCEAFGVNYYGTTAVDERGGKV